MSSHEDPYHSSGSSPIYFEGSSGPPVIQQFQSQGQSWQPTATTGDQIDHTEPHQSMDSVRNLLAVDAEDMSYPFDYSVSNYALPSSSSQDPGVVTGATYTNDNIPLHSFVDLPFYSDPESGYGHSHHQHDYAPYGSTYDSSTPPVVYDAHQHPPQDDRTPQTSQVPFATAYPYSSSTQLLSLSYGGPTFQSSTGAGYSTLGSLPQDANTGRPNASAGQHSHPSPVLTSSNRSSPSGSVHPPPSSPERKRLLPLSAIEELSIGRRVVPRRERAWSIHSTSYDPTRRSRSISNVYGRGPLIPQERYRTSSISSYNACITFDLENPSEIGIPIIDILNKTEVFARLRDRTQAFDMEKKTFTLRVRWPGYRPWAKTIAALDWTKQRAPVTRVKLAEAVAIAIRDLFEKFRNEPYDPDYARWNVGPNGLPLDQICLVALYQVSRGSWQPALCSLGHGR